MNVHVDIQGLAETTITRTLHAGGTIGTAVATDGRPFAYVSVTDAVACTRIYVSPDDLAAARTLVGELAAAVEELEVEVDRRAAEARS